MENSRSARRFRDRIADAASVAHLGLYVGPFLAFVDLFAAEAWWSAGAAWYWVFSYAYYAPALAHLILRRTPPQDHHLAAALLGWASLPWGAFILWTDALTRPDILRWAVLAAMLPGAAVLVATNLTWKPRPFFLRSPLLVSGGVAYLGWVAAYVWLVGQALRPQDAPRVLAMDAGESFLAAIVFLPAPFIAVWMAVRLLVAPLEDAPPA